MIHGFRKLALACAVLMIAAGCSSSENQEAAESATPQQRQISNVKPETGTAGTFKIYGFETAIIEYQVSSTALQSAQRTTYIADWGTYQTEITIGTFIDGSSSRTKMVTRGNQVYNLVTSEEWAIRAEVPNRSSAGIDVGAMVQLAGGEEAALQQLRQRGITLLDSAEVAGFRCQVYEHETEQTRVKVWAYLGLPLKMIAFRKSGGQTEISSQMEATSARFAVPVEIEQFQVPDSYEILTTEEYRQKLQQRKSPGGPSGDSILIKQKGD